MIEKMPTLLYTATKKNRNSKGQFTKISVCKKGHDLTLEGSRAANRRCRICKKEYDVFWQIKHRLQEAAKDYEERIAQLEELLNMQKKTEVELARAERAEVIRTITRLKYRLMANREINEILPDSLEEFDKSLQNGNLQVLDLPEALDVIKTEDS